LTKERKQVVESRANFRVRHFKNSYAIFSCFYDSTFGSNLNKNVNVWL